MCRCVSIEVFRVLRNGDKNASLFVVHPRASRMRHLLLDDAERMSLALAVPSSVTLDNVNDSESDVDSLVKEGSSL